MLKYTDTMVVFSEIPDQITLAINISNCPCHCYGCHSPELWRDIGVELDRDTLSDLIHKNKGIDCVCFMGGDSSPEDINLLAAWVTFNTTLKVAWYSGRDELPNNINLVFFDYIKLGHYDESKGPLTSPTTNQILYKVTDNELVDITKQLQDGFKGCL